MTYVVGKITDEIIEPAIELVVEPVVDLVVDEVLRPIGEELARLPENVGNALERVEDAIPEIITSAAIAGLGAATFGLGWAAAGAYAANSAAVTAAGAALEGPVGDAVIIGAMIYGSLNGGTATIPSPTGGMPIEIIVPPSHLWVSPVVDTAILAIGSSAVLHGGVAIVEEVSDAFSSDNNNASSQVEQAPLLENPQEFRNDIAETTIQNMAILEIYGSTLYAQISVQASSARELLEAYSNGSLILDPNDELEKMQLSTAIAVEETNALYNAYNRAENLMNAHERGDIVMSPQEFDNIQNFLNSMNRGDIERQITQVSESNLATLHTILENTTNTPDVEPLSRLESFQSETHNLLPSVNVAGASFLSKDEGAGFNVQSGITQSSEFTREPAETNNQNTTRYDSSFDIS